MFPLRKFPLLPGTLDQGKSCLIPTLTNFSGSRVFSAATSSQATTAEEIIVDHEDNDECAMTSVTNSVSTQHMQETIVAALDDDNDG